MSVQNHIQILRSEVTATPPALMAGELAYSEASSTLFIGKGDGTVVSIGGVAFTTKLNTIAENANNYTHPITAGNKHIPSGGTVGQILKNSADGTVVWSNESGAVISVAGRTGEVTLSKSDVGLGNANNTKDVDKHVLSATKLKTPRKIANVNFDGTADIDISLSNIIKDANNRTITDAQLTQLQTLYAWYSTMTDDDSDSLINTISEVLDAFSGGEEGLNVATELKNPTAMSLDGGTF